jgi:hypothetical protein
MERIPEELVEKTWKEVSGFSPSRCAEEMRKLSEKQSALVTFVVEFGGELRDEAQELAMYLFFVVYRIFEKGYKKNIKRISPKAIIATYDDNEKLLINLEQVHEKFYERIAGVQLSNQPNIIGYVLDALFEAPFEEEPVDLDEGDYGYIFLLLKTVIDVLNKKTAVKSGGKVEG